MSYHPNNTPPPSNWMVGAILSIFCFWPLAIPAIIFAAKVNSLWNVGDYQGAEAAAKKAKMFSLIAITLGIIGMIIGGIVTAMSIAAANQAVEEYNQEVDALEESLDADLEELDQLNSDLEELESY
ncbi:CD225/dispanin family protein [Nocardiopsis mangrovi]|uniref:CD225/dispanin family protein n=1 Tax=Nocardiopsis mangrovi TaxID=1179818 RepID=A0ABV9DSM7_9ACTN